MFVARANEKIWYVVKKAVDMEIWYVVKDASSHHRVISQTTRLEDVFVDRIGRTYLEACKIADQLNTVEEVLRS